MYIKLHKVKRGLNSLVYPIIGFIPGGLGQRIRWFYWSFFLGSLGKNTRIDIGVNFINPENIHIGENCWIMSFSEIIGGDKNYSLIYNKLVDGRLDGDVVIKNCVQVGKFCVLNGAAGLVLSNDVTLSQGVCIYTATHMPYSSVDRSVRVGSNGMCKDYPVYSKATSITLGEGTWLGVNVVIICASLGKDCFISSGKIIHRNIKDNTYLTQTNETQKRYK